MSRRTARDAFLEELEKEHPETSLDVAASLGLPAPLRAPDPALRERLLRSIAETHRFEEREAAVAAHLDLPVHAVAPLLLAIDDVTPWEPGPRPGIELFHVSGGPKVANAVTGFVRIETGVAFPEHEHLGDEVVLLLQGACEDADGTVYRAGDEMRMSKGTRHHLEAVGPLRLVYLAVIDEGVVIDGVPLRAGDSRA